MRKRFIFALVLLLFCVSSAECVELTFWTGHLSLAGLKDGRSDYSNARFWYSPVEGGDYNSRLTEEDANRQGTLTLSGGNYSYWTGSEMRTVSGTPVTFPLNTDGTGTYFAYWSANDLGRSSYFYFEADGGLNGVAGSFNFPDMPSYNISGVIPNYRTTQEQLNTYVPYVEYIRSGSQVTGLKWRVVKASDTSTPVILDKRIRFRVRNVWASGYEKAYDDSQYTEFFNDSFIDIAAGEKPEGTITFQAPINESDIWGLRCRLRTFEDDVQHDYDWLFFNETNSTPYMYSSSVSIAEFVNYKPYYNNSKFYGIYLDVEADDLVIEAKYLTDKATLTIPGGGYTLRNDDDWAFEDIGSVASGVSKSFKLKLKSDINTNFQGDDYVEYVPVDDNGTALEFAGGAEKGLNGRTITWTFPDSSMNGSAVIPNYKSTSEQLEQGVPYFELVSSDGNVTAVNYRIVKPYDTSTAVTLPYNADFRITLNGNDERRDSGWMNKTSGTWVLDEPISLESIRNASRMQRVRLRTYEDASNPCIYIWTFQQSNITPEPYPKPEQDNGGGGGGGCNLGISIAALGLLAILTKKR